MPGMQYDGTANMRANEVKQASSVPAGRASAGKDVGGKENFRATPEAPATSVPSKAAGSNANRLPFTTFKDRSV